MLRQYGDMKAVQTRFGHRPKLLKARTGSQAGPAVCVEAKGLVKLAGAWQKEFNEAAFEGCRDLEISSTSRLTGSAVGQGRLSRRAVAVCGPSQASRPQCAMWGCRQVELTMWP